MWFFGRDVLTIAVVFQARFCAGDESELQSNLRLRRYSSMVNNVKTHVVFVAFSLSKGFFLCIQLVILELYRSFIVGL